MLDQLLIANSSLLGITASLVAKMVRSPATRASLLQWLASIRQNRVNRLVRNHHCGAVVLDANTLEKGTCGHCLLSTDTRRMEMAEVGNQSAIPGIIVVEEPET